MKPRINSVEYDVSYNAYITVVFEVKKLKQYDTPEIIRQLIESYYEHSNNPDDLSSLFAYIIIQANVYSLWSEVELIDDFVCDN